MACTSLPNSPLLFLQLTNPKIQPCHHIPFPPKSSHSQFHGQKLSISSPHFSQSSPPNSFRTSICAKVSKGDVPPNFTLKDQDGKNVAFSKFKGKPVVLYYYPGDETPGCTKEACAFRDSYEKFKKAGAEVVGISGDDPASHKACAFRDSYEKFKKAGAEVVGISGDDPASLKAFAKKYRLSFTLLSDEGNKVRKDWAVPSDLFGTLPGRQTYVIDRKGVVQLVYNNLFQPEKHVDETLKLLQSL